MTIEFHCPYCQKLLKTADDKAGVRANCPGCGEQITVPDAAHEAAQAEPVLDTGDESAPPSAEPGLAFAPPESGLADTKTCPMCGEQIKRAATRCRFCGENLVEQPHGVPTTVEAGAVMSRAWEIFQQKLGLLIGSTLIYLGIQVALGIAFYIAWVALFLGVVGPAAGGRPNPAVLVAAVYGPMFMFMLLSVAVNAYLEGGYHILLCRIVRGEPAELGDMFSGGRYFWRMLGANLIFMIAIYIGMALLVAPAIFIGLAFWPFMYVMVDHDVGVIESFRRSRELTSGNYLAIFVVTLAAWGAWILGSLVCYIGLIFTAPFAFLLFAVAYCMMSGEIPARASGQPPH